MIDILYTVITWGLILLAFGFGVTFVVQSLRGMW